MFLIFLLVLFVPMVSFAEDDLVVNSWQVKAQLDENGDLYVIENISYDFNAKFNGVFRDIVAEGIDSLEGLKIYEIKADQRIEYGEKPQAQKGEAGVYTRNLEDDAYQIMIFSPANNEKKTFRFEYILRNVAIKHSDIGELYFKFVGSENETFVNSFLAQIDLPQFNQEDIKIFAHGPANGEINFIDRNYIRLQVEDLSPKQMVEARVLFPLDYIAASNKSGHKDLDTILEEERALDRAAKAKEEARLKQRDTLNKLAIGLTGLAGLVLAFIYNKFRRDPQIFRDLQSPYPEEISPAELSLFMNSSISARSYLATIFDLASRGFLEIEEIKVEKKKRWLKDNNEKEFLFIRKDKVGPLLEHEAHLLDWLFNRIGNGQKVDTYQIKKYRERNGISFYKDYNKWNKLVDRQLKSRDYDEPRRTAPAFVLISFGAILLVFSILALLYNATYAIFTLVTGAACLIYGFILAMRKSDKGYLQKKLWEEFKKDIGKYEGEIGITTDKSLIYAIALGLPMKELEDYRSSIDTGYYPMYWGYWFFYTNRRGGSIIEDRINHGFYGHEGTSTSTSTFGGGGGFTGGGGGGAGGGGTGGF